MKQIIYIIIIPLLLISCKRSRSIGSIVNDFENQIDKEESWEYNIHYKMKYFKSDEDTLNYFSNCRLIRHKSDTIFGGSFWIKNDSIDRYYDLENIYIINHSDRKIIRFFPKKGQDWVIKGNAINGVLDSYFLKPNRLSKYLKDSTIITQLRDTIIDQENLNAIALRFKDEPYIEQQRKRFYFNQNNKLKSIIYSVRSLNEWQYNEWHFTNEIYDQVTDKTLKLEFDSLARTYKIEDYKEPDPKEMEPLANGFSAPKFNGFNFQTNDSIKFQNFKNKYIILDFWYKDCFPCIKAIALLNKLRVKYSKEKLDIFGLNPFDGKNKNKEKLAEFIEVNEMNYPTVFIRDRVTKDYNVIAYPTFYIINKEGKIIYSKIGHSKKNEKEIDSLLSELIK